MKNLILLVIMLAFIANQGCSMVKATEQPGKKDISLFKVGTPRNLLLAEFGTPITSEERKGKRYEIFKFVQGYNKPTKTGRAIAHGGMDIVTFGLWELVATPTEAIFDGKEMAYQVRYDDNDIVDEVMLLGK